MQRIKQKKLIVIFIFGLGSTQLRLRDIKEECVRYIRWYGRIIFFAQKPSRLRSFDESIHGKSQEKSNWYFNEFGPKW